MSHAFRELLRKIGSGTHTSESLTRQESAAAMRMMLLQEATPAQIGAFMIAHRIRRPTSTELAGMLDAYAELGPRLSPIAADHPVTVFGVPYDGRSRTAPILPLTALILATAGCPVLMHGGDRMPTKEGDPLIDYWKGLGVDWSLLSLSQTQTVLETTGIGFVYLPTHFPLAHGLVPYREQIGKRPPLATMELMWSPYAGAAHVVAGYVHPPTEERFRETFAHRGITQFTTVKGLEGSCDLPRERTGIIGMQDRDRDFERLHLHPRDYGFEGTNVPLDTPANLVQVMQTVLQGEQSELWRSTLWNGGFYLWRLGVCPTIADGITHTETLLQTGQVQQTLQTLQQAITPAIAHS
ncbi:MAG TPA: anthranilate phosphoribosyltransferase family protein [Microcoleaceae cyanobacterium]|jgi:anthranilate phosphoribosyltransferase